MASQVILCLFLSSNLLLNFSQITPQERLELETMTRQYFDSVRFVIHNILLHDVDIYSTLS
jgi:hypothetical protein